MLNLPETTPNAIIIRLSELRTAILAQAQAAETCAHDLRTFAHAVDREGVGVLKLQAVELSENARRVLINVSRLETLRELAFAMEKKT